MYTPKLLKANIANKAINATNNLDCTNINFL